MKIAMDTIAFLCREFAEPFSVPSAQFDGFLQLVKVSCGGSGCKRDRQTRPTDRQTDRQTGRQTDRARLCVCVGGGGLLGGIGVGGLTGCVCCNERCFHLHNISNVESCSGVVCPVFFLRAGSCAFEPVLSTF